MTKITVQYVIQARLNEPQAEWYVMPGFMYDSEPELRQVYDRHFRAIDGQGCQYRLSKITETVTVQVTDLEKS